MVLCVYPPPPHKIFEICWWVLGMCVYMYIGSVCLGASTDILAWSLMLDASIIFLTGSMIGPCVCFEFALELVSEAVV